MAEAMKKWKDLIAAGNDTNCGDEASIAYYEQAKEEAHHLLNDDSNFEGGVAALVVSYHNLAELYSKIGQRDKGRAQLELVNRHVMQKLADTPKTSDKVSILQSALHRTHFALLKEDEMASILHKRHKGRITHELNPKTAYKRDPHNLHASSGQD